MSIKFVISVLAALVAVMGCGKDTTQRKPLPENSGLAAHVTDESIRKSAVGWLRSGMTKDLARAKSTFMASAQASVAERRLTEAAPSSPVVLAALAGRLPDGSSGFTLYAINPNRESNTIVIFCEAPSGERRALSIPLDPHEKDAECLIIRHFKTDLVPWTVFLSNIQDGIMPITDGRIQFPEDECYERVAVALGDRMTGLSAFVGVVAYVDPHSLHNYGCESESRPPGEP
jgi:hypothetical protein